VLLLIAHLIPCHKRLPILPGGRFFCQVDASRDSELLNAAETLASALNAEGIAATVNTKTEPDTNAAAIHILIGPKP
jgi:hypothetical protein